MKSRLAVARAARAIDNHPMSSTRRVLAASLALACLVACRLFPKANGVTLASDPPGARILVDGKDTGFVTPCALALDVSEDYRIDFEHPGYITASRYITSDHRVYVIYWREMYVSSNTWLFPLWLNFADFFVPMKYERGAAPGRLYVRLERAASR